MGVPDDDCPVVPAKKRPRLSLKANKQKAEVVSKTVEENSNKPENKAWSGTPVVKEESSSDVEEVVTENCCADSLTTMEQDSRVPAVASLENFGNTCFMNSILQVLRYTPGFLDNLAQLFQDIVASEKIKRKNKNNDESEEACSFEEGNCKKCWKVVRNVYRVYRDLALLEDKYEEVASDDVMSMAVKPSKVLSSIRDLNPMFEGNLQHDAQEFLRCLLCYLQDAEKDVQKFYSQLPPRLSPRATVLNPIMQRFLKAAQKIGKCQIENSSSEDPVADINVKKVEDTKTDAVKVNLFPKDAVEDKTEAAKSPSKIQVGPNLGDTASIVDKKSATDIQSGAVPKSNNSDSSDLQKNDDDAMKNTNVELPSAIGRPSRSRGMARRGRRFTPYKHNANLRCNSEKKTEESKADEKNDKVRRSKRDASPDKLQPTISDMFGTKTYSSKKRLGMTGSVLKRSSEQLFDEMQGREKQTMNTSSPRKSQSMPILNDNSKHTDLQPFVSLTDVQNKISPEIKIEKKSNDNKIERKSDDKNANAKSDTSIDSMSESSKDMLPKEVVEETQQDNLVDQLDKAADTDDSRSFQDIFAQFLQGPTCIYDSDSDSVDLLSESDNEDIVMQKKVAKQIHESPRRSPRKQPENYQRSPRKSQSLEIPKQSVASYSPRKVLSYESKNKITLDNFIVTSQSPPKDANITHKVTDDDDSAKCKFSDETLNTSDEKTHNCDQKLETNIDQKSEMIVRDRKSPGLIEAGERNLFPIVKLEKCDHVFNNGSCKSVSANYATKCLTPVKNSPKKADVNDSSNYLKHRNLLAELDIKNEKDLQRAVEEMYNSPIKSRSKCDLIERLFQGSMMLRTRCLQCESSRERREDFHDVSVPVRLEQSDSDDEEEGEDDSRCGLMKLIEASTEVEKLLEDNKYYCEECKSYVEAERSMLYDVMPDILTLHLKRFSATAGKYGSITKINDEVEIPFTLPCLRYRCPKVCLRPDHRYSLYAIVTHSGVTLTAGHYLAYVRALNKQTDINQDTTETDLTVSVKQEEDKNVKSEKTAESEKLPTSGPEKSGKKVPVTRKKMGITAKLPSRFEDSVTDTKVKAFKATAKPKAKPRLADCLTPSKRFSTEWFECDDETVRVFSEEDFKDMVEGRSGAMLGTPYLLFYHKATMV